MEVEIYPPDGGTVSVEELQHYTKDWFSYVPYRITATPSEGMRFVRFVLYKKGGWFDPEWRYTARSRANPYVGDDMDDDNTPIDVKVTDDPTMLDSKCVKIFALFGNGKILRNANGPIMCDGNVLRILTDS